jgi:hypothetical protein
VDPGGPPAIREEVYGDLLLSFIFVTWSILSILRTSGWGWLGGYGNLPLFFFSFSSFFFLADDHFSLLNSVSRHGYRDMMHIKQARERLGWAGWQGRGENGSGCFCFFWALDSFLLLLPFILQQRDCSVTYDQLSLLETTLNLCFRHTFFWLPACLRCASKIARQCILRVGRYGSIVRKFGFLWSFCFPLYPSMRTVSRNGKPLPVFSAPSLCHKNCSSVVQLECRDNSISPSPTLVQPHYGITTPIATHWTYFTRLMCSYAHRRSRVCIQ